MPYVHISHVPGRSLDDMRAVTDAVGDELPAGILLSIRGEDDAGIHIIDVWASRVDADRFAAERLLPAFTRTGRGPDASATYVAFDTDDIVTAAPGLG